MKFRSSLFKGLRFPKAEPWSPSADGDILQTRRFAKSEIQNSPVVDCFERENALQERAFLVSYCIWKRING